MLITRRDGELLLVTQPDHARLAGDIVLRWGNETFDPSSPRDAVHAAAVMHDDGWRDADARPLFNADEARPLHFLEIGMDEHIPLYRRGVERAVEADPYAGLLVSMHWTGLYRGRWGLQDGRVQWSEGTRIEQLQTEAVEAEERRWIEVKRGLMRDTPRTDFEARLWHNYDLLQAWDLLSLYVCLLDHTPADGIEPQPVPATLKRIDQTPGDRILQSVPLGVARERVDIALRAVEPGVVTLDPYPFDAPEIEFSVAGTAIADRRYADLDDAATAVAAGERCTLGVRMTPA